MKTTILLALCVALSGFALLPTAEAANGCTVLDGHCPGFVCYGRGDHYGYKVCVGPGYCDPAACEPWLP